MSNSHTLLSFLVPKLTSQVENAATDGLCYILKKSESAMDAFNLLLQQGGYAGNQIVRVETQVAYEDASRPDMTGYDEHNGKHLLVEVKFWASLGEAQAGEYLEQLDETGPAILLFIAPQARIESLWADIVHQIDEAGGRRLEALEISDVLRSAKVAGEEKHLMLVSWRRLLNHLADSAANDVVKGDIRQLQGLAEGQDSVAFLPLHGEDMNPEIARRMSSYKTLVDNVVERGVTNKWLNITGLKVTPRWHGYGRYFRFPVVVDDFWIGVNCEKWAASDNTPLWIWDVRGDPNRINAIGSALTVRVYDSWIPIHLKKIVEFHVVLEDVARQLKTIGKVVGANKPDD